MGYFRNLWDEALAAKNNPGSNNTLLVSRTITIIRPNTLSGSDSNPPSPAGSSSAASSPLSVTSPREDHKKLTLKKMTTDAARSYESKSPTGYEWFVLLANSLLFANHYNPSS
ncbi:Dormancyauxin associated [Artemisia annua]|uniref:Dormancyauxin associated n=1 Tax=Artemisia annua TaxID=35608 RepID=A0A2U1P535_ARTAN|nr:Dormancyauxin associated [Artemisia annua]